MKTLNKQTGFSLLEVMIAIAILATSLVVLLNFQSTAVLSSGRAQSLSVATLLARHQMAQLIIQLEENMVKQGLPEDKTEAGDFSEIGYPDYRWEMAVRKVEVPAPPLPEEAGGDLVNKIVENITEQISRATRELLLTVIWKELEEDQSISVVTHLVDLKSNKFGGVSK